MPLSSVLGAASVIKAGVVTSSTRPAVPYVGQLIYETDTNRLAAYNGSAWVSQNSLQLVATASPSAVSSVSINNCFTSTYENYKVIINLTNSVGADAAFSTRLRASGTDATTQYATARLYWYSTNVGASLSTGGNGLWWTSAIDPTYKDYFIELEIHNPQTAMKTTASITASGADSAGNLWGYRTNGVHDGSTQFDGITFSTAGTSFTGTIRVYGYSNS